MVSRKLKIGMDFHGVITEAPSFFREFTALAFDHGHEIHIISGGPYLVERNFLDTWKISYTTIFAMVDHFASLGQIEYFANGNFKVPDELWNKAKAEYCLANDIDIQIDDTPSYGDFFTTPFCWYNAAGRVCDLGNKIVDFSHSPEKSLEEIENYLLHKI